MMQPVLTDMRLEELKNESGIGRGLFSLDTKELNTIVHDLLLCRMQLRMSSTEHKELLQLRKFRNQEIELFRLRNE